MPSDDFLKALNSLDILREIDLVLVPQRAHRDMIKIGAQAAGVSDIQAMIVYEAMLQQALIQPVDQRCEHTTIDTESKTENIIYYDVSVNS